MSWLPSSRWANVASSTEVCSSDWIAVYGSLIAGDNALTAMSASCRTPKATSCSAVRSKPRRTATGMAERSFAGSSDRGSGDGAHSHSSGAPSTTYSPTMVDTVATPSWSRASGSSTSGCTVWTQPDWYAGTATAQAGGEDV